MRFGYADPPYPGHTKRSRYKHDPLNAEVDHAVLVASLVADYPDGWALSSSRSALRDILPLFPPDIRVMAWVKPFCSFKPNVNPAYTWEPLIVRGGRKRERFETTVRDFVSCNIIIKAGLCGAKPDGFIDWLCEVLNVQPGDTVDEPFPGTGRVGARITERLATQAGKARGDG